MKIYTKRGDEGFTDLFGGARLMKSHIRVKAYGDIDRANTAIGLAYSAQEISPAIKEELVKLMKLLFCAGAEVATAPTEHAQKLLRKHSANIIDEQHTLMLEQTIDDIESRIPALKSFILPCGTDLSARLHYARTLVRAAEISLVDLREQGEMVRGEIIKFFNRLSDLLFMLARLANHEQGVLDILWSGQLEPSFKSKI